MWAQVLAQAGQSQAVGEILLWVGVLVAALVVLGIVLVALRKRLLAPVRAPEAGMFDQLRRMREEGSITSEEYDAIRQRMVARVAGRDTTGGEERPDSRAVGVNEGADSSRPRQPPID
jgi:hypothetical protein